MDIESNGCRETSTGLIQLSPLCDSSPGSLSSLSTAGSSHYSSQSPPQLAAFLVNSPKAPPASLSASKPTLTSYHSASNPQPFFPTTTDSPTTWQFPTATQHSGTRTPSPPGVHVHYRSSRSTPRLVRARRDSMDERPVAPASAGRPSALASNSSSGDGANQLEAKVVIRELTTSRTENASRWLTSRHPQLEARALARLQ